MAYIVANKYRQYASSVCIVNEIILLESRLCPHTLTQLLKFSAIFLFYTSNFSCKTILRCRRVHQRSGKSARRKLRVGEPPSGTSTKSGNLTRGGRQSGGKFLLWTIVTFVSLYFNPLPPVVVRPVKWNEGSFHQRRKAVGGVPLHQNRPRKHARRSCVLSTSSTIFSTDRTRGQS